MWQPIATSVIFYMNENRDGLNCFQNLCIKVYSGLANRILVANSLHYAVKIIYLHKFY